MQANQNFISPILSLLLIYYDCETLCGVACDLMRKYEEREFNPFESNVVSKTDKLLLLKSEIPIQT